MVKSKPMNFVGTDTLEENAESNAYFSCVPTAVLWLQRLRIANPASPF